MFQSRTLMFIFHFLWESLSNCFWVWDLSVHLIHSIDYTLLQWGTVRNRQDHPVFGKKYINAGLLHTILTCYHISSLFFSFSSPLSSFKTCQEMWASTVPESNNHVPLCLRLDLCQTTWKCNHWRDLKILILGRLSIIQIMRQNHIWFSDNACCFPSR